MSFWIASPSMDPEMFLLSVASLGWELALWRLGATLVLSLAAGFATQWLWSHGLLGKAVLLPAAAGACGECGAGAPRRPRLGERLRRAVATVRAAVGAWLPALAPATASAACCGAGGAGAACGEVGEVALVSIGGGSGAGAAGVRSSVDACATCAPPQIEATSACGRDGFAPAIAVADAGRVAPFSPAPESLLAGRVAPVSPAPGSLLRTVGRETLAASLMVGKFMALAFLLEALFELYVPAEWIAALAAAQGPLPVLYAALVGVPLYTSNLAALPLIASLLQQGMAPAAALAFLIAGPTTTLPAMAAVWGLVNRRVFALYVGFAFCGALAAGWAWSFAH
jgi:uncharacterized membrane protein YraQ (UPF0718 family)